MALVRGQKDRTQRNFQRRFKSVFRVSFANVAFRQGASRWTLNSHLPYASTAAMSLTRVSCGSWLISEARFYEP